MLLFGIALQEGQSVATEIFKSFECFTVTLYIYFHTCGAGVCRIALNLSYLMSKSLILSSFIMYRDSCYFLYFAFIRKTILFA